MKNILIVSLLLILYSCDSSQNNHTNVEEEAIAEDSHFNDTSIDEVVEVEKKKSEPEQDKSFAPDKAQIAKYEKLKQKIIESQEPLKKFLADGNNQNYKPTKSKDSQNLLQKVEHLSQLKAKEYILKENLSPTEFADDLNIIGLSLIYSSIHSLKDKPDFSKTLTTKLSMKSLIADDIITDTKLVKYKVYETEMNSKSKPAPGQEGVKMRVDEDGNIFIGQQKMGVAEERNGEFYMKFEPGVLMN